MMKTLNVENMKYTIISRGHDTEGFYDEEIVGCIRLDKDDLEVFFNLWIKSKRMNSWYEFIVCLFEDMLPTCH